MNLFEYLFHPIHGPSAFLLLVEKKLGVDAANQIDPVLQRVMAAPNINWLQIIQVLIQFLPFILSLIPGANNPIVQEIIAALLALLNPTPTPAQKKAA